MKRIYCSLLVVMFVLFSPLSAFASTTESMLMYAASDDEYAVMPLAAVDNFNVSFEVGEYDISTDSYNRAAIITPFSQWSNPTTDTFCVMPGDFGNQGMYYYSKFGLSNLNVSVPGTMRFVCSNVLQAVLVDPHYLGICSAAVPFNCFVEVDLSGTTKSVIGNTFVTYSDTIILPYSNFANAYRNDSFGYVQDWDVTLDFSLPTESIYLSGSEHKWHSTRNRNI